MTGTGRARGVAGAASTAVGAGAAAGGETGPGQGGRLPENGPNGRAGRAGGARADGDTRSVRGGPAPGAVAGALGGREACRGGQARGWERR